MKEIKQNYEAIDRTIKEKVIRKKARVTANKLEYKRKEQNNRKQWIQQRNKTY